MLALLSSQIRRATPTDFERIREVTAAANEEFRGLMPRSAFDGYLASALDVEGRVSSGGEVLVAEIDDVVAGTVTFYANAADEGMEAPFAPRTAGLRVTAVDPSFRGRGLGRALVRRCIERAVDTGATSIALHTAHVMVAAIALYEGLGFVRRPALDYRSSAFFGGDPAEAIDAIAFVRPVP